MRRQDPLATTASVAPTRATSSSAAASLWKIRCWDSESQAAQHIRFAITIGGQLALLVAARASEVPLRPVGFIRRRR